MEDSVIGMIVDSNALSLLLKTMKKFYNSLSLSLFILLSIPSFSQTPSPWDDPKKLQATILHLDSLFWHAYNTCDIDKMGTFFTDDVEFYHDKGGLTNGKASLMEATRKGICAGSDFYLRREARKGSVEVFPMNNYGAIISGEHYFYVNGKGKKETLDGLAKFTHVWRYKDNEWKMHRVLSYDHGPASRKPPIK